MNISSKYVGAVCKPLEVEVSTRHCINYAAAIGDANPWHLDDARPEGIIAPPMLAVALSWRISERFPEYWGGADFPYEALARQVHFSEVLEWKRVMRPGDRLRIQGEVTGILPHRAGTHLIITYTATDNAGDVVFIEHIGGLLRGVKCADEGRGRDAVEPADLQRDAEPIWTRQLHIGRFAPYVYDACAEVHFPIHISPAFAKSVGLPGIIFQGTGALAMAVRELVAACADNDPRRVRGVQCRFSGMIMPDSTITLQVMSRTELKTGIQYTFNVLNVHGKPALSSGSILLA